MADRLTAVDTVILLIVPPKLDTDISTRKSHQNILSDLEYIIEVTPNVVPDRRCLLRDLKDPHPSVDLLLLANSEAICVHPCAVHALECFTDCFKVVKAT